MVFEFEVKLRTVSVGLAKRFGCGMPGVCVVLQDFSSPDAVEGAAGLRARVGVGDERLLMGELDQLLIATLVPEGKRERTHEGAIAIGVFVRPSGFAREIALREFFDCFSRLYSHVEYVFVNCEVAVEIPVLQALGKVDEIELVSLC